MAARVHPTALIEDGVAIGDGTAVWDGVHVRGPGTTIGSDCIVGEKTHISYGVTIGDRVKIIEDLLRRVPHGRPIVQITYGPMSPVPAGRGVGGNRASLSPSLRYALSLFPKPRSNFVF